MTTIRTARAADGNFTQLTNKMLQDPRISDRARGLAARVLSYPPDTSIQSTSLADGTVEGRDAVRAAMKELETFGYLIRTRTQDAKGKWSTDCLLTDGPAPGEPTPGKPSSVPPAAMHETAGRTEDGISGANYQTRKKETRVYPPTPHEEPATVVADAPGGHQLLLQEQDKDAAAGGEAYSSAVADITSHMLWQPTNKTRQQLTSTLAALVPDPAQLPLILDRSAGWVSRPEKTNVNSFRGRVRKLKTEIDSGVTPIRGRGVQRSEVSLDHGHVTTLDEFRATGGW